MARDHPPPAPDHLSPAASTIWRELTAELVLTTERRILLGHVLEDFDRCRELRERITADGGPILRSQRSGLPHAHAGVKMEAEPRARFVRGWRALGLNAYRPSGWPV